MNSEMSCENDLPKLMNQLSIARKELQNIRKDLRRLNYSYRKDIEHIMTSLKNWRCESCSSSTFATDDALKTEMTKRQDGSNRLLFQPIGYISSPFREKKGTPRQPGICIDSHGKIVLSNSVFTNPDHTLDGLEQYSHMWVLFHFHRNDSKHVRAKVAPPRLNGLKTGVFGTRSPHRPSPIGLSLVRVDRVEGGAVHFSGVDMLDGTPVLDIKPYIPQYDDPSHLECECRSKSVLVASILKDDAVEQGNCIHLPREAPDGQESGGSDLIASVSPLATCSAKQIRVPQWISEPLNSLLMVTFKEKARLYFESFKNNKAECDQLEQNYGETIEKTITRVLEEDPRSAYVRERYSNQFYTFLIGSHHVSCKFDDTNHSVQVYKITKASPLSEWKGSFDDSECDN